MLCEYSKWWTVLGSATPHAKKTCQLSSSIIERKTQWETTSFAGRTGGTDSATRLSWAVLLDELYEVQSANSSVFEPSAGLRSILQQEGLGRSLP